MTGRTAVYILVAALALSAVPRAGAQERMARLPMVSAGQDAEAGLESFTGKMTLDLKDMEIGEALRYIADKMGINIITTKDVTGRVSLSVKDVALKDVFDIILRSNNLAYEKKGNIFNIMSENEYKARFGRNFTDSRVTRVFRLKYAIPEQAFNLLNTLKSEIGKILYDADSGVILAMDTPEKIHDMETTLEAMDQKGVIKVFNLKYARAKDIEEQLKTQLDVKKVGSIKADERTNQVIVQTLEERMEDIGRLIAGLDQKTRQILIDAKIIQVKLINDLSAGVEWEGLFDLGSKNGEMTYLGSYPFSSVNSSTDSWRSRKQTLEDVGYAGSYPFTGTTTSQSAGKQSVGTEEMHLGLIGSHDFDLIVKYMQTLGETRILSNPKLAVVNNQEARIHVGERQAYITTTTTQTQTSTTVSEAVTYVDVGIQLMVTPTINEDGYVTVKIKPEISSVISYLETSSNNRIPIIDTSTAETIVMVKDGTSILIGGLSKEDKADSVSQTPILSKIPVVGQLFKSATNKSTRSELLVLLTPHIVTGDELVTGREKRDFTNRLDKEYQQYQKVPAPMETFEYKPYQGYTGGQKQELPPGELPPGIKPTRNL